MSKINRGTSPRHQIQWQISFPVESFIRFHLDQLKACTTRVYCSDYHTICGMHEARQFTSSWSLSLCALSNVVLSSQVFLVFLKRCAKRCHEPRVCVLSVKVSANESRWKFMLQLTIDCSLFWLCLRATVFLLRKHIWWWLWTERDVRLLTEKNRNIHLFVVIFNFFFLFFGSPKWVDFCFVLRYIIITCIKRKSSTIFAKRFIFGWR